MERRGLIIRFIDVGLILLFGFLMISEVHMHTQIGFPGAVDDLEASSLTDSNEILVVSVREDDSYAITHLAEEDKLHDNIRSTEELEFFLKTLKQQRSGEINSFSILIDPEENARMQLLVNLLDVCERLDIPKMLMKEELTTIPSS